MVLSHISKMKGGWFVGAFDPTCHFTRDFEVSYKTHKAGENWGIHYHTRVKEINFLAQGSMTIQGKLLVAGDIFILEPFEIADPIFWEDCGIVCVKIPSANDKVEVEIKKS
jgi:mannose-6-phosphate isomerase-like protein (cupin superfamily)